MTFLQYDTTLPLLRSDSKIDEDKFATIFRRQYPTRAALVDINKTWWILAFPVKAK